MIVLRESEIIELCQKRSPNARSILLGSVDEGDVFSSLASNRNVPSTICLTSNSGEIIPDEVVSDRDIGLVAASIVGGDRELSENVYRINGIGSIRLQGYKRIDGTWRSCPVYPVPGIQGLFQRNQGILETDLLKDKKVAVVGLGSVGSRVLEELTKLGVMNFQLFDHDRLEPGNISRHWCGVEDLYRMKVCALRDKVLNVNPYAQFELDDREIDWDRYDRLAQTLRDTDLAICLPDNRKCRQIVNKLCMELNKTALYGGALSRAHALQVLRVIPNESLCYNCFTILLDEKKRNGGSDANAPFNEESSEPTAYSDRPAAVEPGLSNDLLPLTHMLTKLALCELIRGKDTTLKPLQDDLSASWYIYANRYEGNYRQLRGTNFCINRWYPVRVERVESCPICGQSTGLEPLEECGSIAEMVKLAKEAV